MNQKYPLQVPPPLIIHHSISIHHWYTFCGTLSEHVSQIFCNLFYSLEIVSIQSSFHLGNRKKSVGAYQVNKQKTQISHQILNSIPDKATSLYTADTVMYPDESVQYPTKILNSLEFSGTLSHNLH